MLKQRATLAAAAATLALAPALVNALTIDEFDTDQAALTVAPNTPPQSDSSVAQTAGSDIIGLERDMLLTVPSGLSPFSSLAAVDNGAFIFANDSDASATIHFQWDGDDDNATGLDPLGLGGLDLTEGSTIDAFEFRFLIGDLPSILTMTVHTDGANSSSVSFPHPGLQLTTDLVLIVPFAVFSGSADFANVGAIELEISAPTTALDMKIDYIRTTLNPVPIPAPLLLLGSALVGLGMTRRRG